MNRLLIVLTVAMVGWACSAGGSVDHLGDGSVLLLHPVGEASVSGVILVEVGVLSGAEQVQLFVDDAGFQVWTRPSDTQLVTSLDTTTLLDGVHRIRVEASWGLRAPASAESTVVIDNGGPAIVIEEPHDHVFHEDGPFAVVVRVADGTRVDSLTVRVDGRTVEHFQPVMRDRYVVTVDPVELLPAGADLGSVVVSAEADDEAGHVGSAERELEIRSRRAWSFDTLGAVWEAPEQLADGAVAVSTAEGVLHIVTAEGVERCHVRADGERGVGSPTYVPGSDAVVWGTTHHLRVTSAATCEHLFEHPLGGEFVAKPVVTAAGLIVATSFTGTMVSFRADGTEATQTDLAPLVAGGAAMEVKGGTAATPESGVYQAVKIGSTGGALFAVRPDGTVEVAELTAPVEGDLLTTDQLVVFGARDGSLYAYGHDLVRRWIASVNEGLPLLTRPVFDGSAIVMGDGEGRIQGRDPASGEVVWEYDALLERSPSGVGLVGRAGLTVAATGEVAFGDALGMVHVLTPGGAVRWRSQIAGGGSADGIVARPSMTAERMYVATESQRLVAYAMQ